MQYLFQAKIRQMKKNQLYALTLLFAIISLGLSSCSKEKSFSSGGSGGTGGTGGGGGTGGSSSYFMKFKINGVQKEFTANTFAVFSSIDIVGTTIYTASIQGTLSTSSSTTNLMGININDVTPIVANKDYSDATVGQTIQGALLYFDATGEQYSTLLVPTDVNLKIRITELTSTVVAGTFSGKMQSMTGTTVLNVTEGSFKLKR